MVRQSQQVCRSLIGLVYVTLAARWMRKTARFNLLRQYVPERVHEPPLVEPVRLLAACELDGFEAILRPTSVDEFDLIEAN